MSKTPPPKESTPTTDNEELDRILKPYESLRCASCGQKSFEVIYDEAKAQILKHFTPNHEVERLVTEAELNNAKALKQYMVSGSATFVDWVNYLDERIAQLAPIEFRQKGKP